MRKKFASIITISFLLLIFTLPVFANNNKIIVKLNGEILDFDVEPFLKNGISYVPMRKIVESLGGTVVWNEDRALVDVGRGNKKILIDTRTHEIYVDGSKLDLEDSFLIKDGRILLPLRLISESFGYKVAWQSKKTEEFMDLIHIYRNSAGGKLVNGNREVSIFMEEEEVLKNLGQPSRKDRAIDGGTWYIYNSSGDSYRDHIQLRIKDGRLVEIETNAETWVLDNIYKNGESSPVNINDELNKVYRDYGFTATIHKDYRGKNFLINLSELNLSKNYRNKVDLDHLEALENRFFDYTNVVRINSGIQALEKHEDLKKLAKEHSLDMASKSYFSHRDFKGQSFESRFFANTRMNKGGENIANCSYLPGQAVLALYNSEGHRNNILGDFKYLGVGVAVNIKDNYKTYYTQNFGQ